MDLAKLIDQRDKFIAGAAAALERRSLDPAALKPPVDLQEAQAERVRKRIDGLERRKAALVASIDTELAELKRDLKAREQRIGGQRSAGKDAVEAASADGASNGRKTSRAAASATKKAGSAAVAADKKAGATPSKGK